MDGGPATGTLTWEVEVANVARQWCSDIDMAWQLIEPLAGAAGTTENTFRDDPFTERLHDGAR